MDYEYTGLHAFLFIDRVQAGKTPADVVSGLRGLGSPPDGPVIFASEFVGQYLAFAHVWVEEGDLSGLQDLITGDLWEMGVRCRYCIEAAVHTNPVTLVHSGTKRATPEIIALVSIVVERGRVQEVLNALGGTEEVEGVPGFKGASVVTGDFDILLQLGGDNLDDVLQAAMTSLQEIDGIVHTSTAFADGTR
jgi:DNA-binding Lrp family transcriptional regulator